MLADLRDSIAVTLMGWCAKLATRQYQRELAEYIQLGMARELTQREAPAYGEEQLDGSVHARWVSLS
jgi:hypothetical protein